MKKLLKPLTENQVDCHRRESCTEYDDCLRLAGRLNWPSFSCEGCGDYQRGVVEYELYVDDETIEPPNDIPQGISEMRRKKNRTNYQIDYYRKGVTYE
jgi:hypothetical protein